MDDDYDNDYDNDGGGDGAAAVSRPDPTAFAVGAAPARPATVEDAAESLDTAAAEEAPPLELPEVAPGILQFSAIFAGASVPKPSRRQMPVRRMPSSKGRAGVQFEQSDASRMRMAQEDKAAADAAKASPGVLDVWARTQLRVMGMAGDSGGGGGGGGGGNGGGGGGGAWRR